MLSAIVTKSMSSVTHVTVTTTDGAISTATSSIVVGSASTIPRVKLTKHPGKKGHMSAAGGTSLGQVPVLATECLPAGGNTAKMAKAPRVGAVKAASQAPTTSAGGTPGCTDQVEIGIVQGSVASSSSTRAPSAAGGGEHPLPVPVRVHRAEGEVDAVQDRRGRDCVRSLSVRGSGGR